VITREHTAIRSADVDDAPALARLYDPQAPRAALLDSKREPLRPSADELQELLTRRAKLQSQLYAVEDRTGLIRGFIAVRAAGDEAPYAEVAVLLFDDADYETPLADEALAFLDELAFQRRKYVKVMVHCLDTERAAARFYERAGFTRDGTHREIVYTLGCWHDLESWSRYNEEG
jgi:RimJ/RimL family protein N-acetyltransferase